MKPVNIDSIILVLLSLITFALIGGWLLYREIKTKGTLFNKPLKAKKIRVGDTIYVVKEKSRIVAVEKATGHEVIVTTCGVEEGEKMPQGEMTTLPEGVKVCYKLDNGIYTPEESDWRAGDDFDLIGVRPVKEYVAQG
ncbi:MAG: hypothetical protein C0621_03665 [Desulfuromonas sp.]|nr:MAG: hypothetical protein C0621_03665 [Desulfuromonas sp.]